MLLVSFQNNKTHLSTPKSLASVDPVKIAFTFKSSFANQSVKMSNCFDIYLRSKILQRMAKSGRKDFS